MTLKNYILNGPSVVIADDDRDPWVSWQHHLDRTNGQRGGVDLVAPVGTPVYAPTNGWVVRLPDNGSAGNSMEFHHYDNMGWSDVFSHLSSYVNKNDFKQGEIIAYTGNTGGVDPHLHRHLLDPYGVRRNPWDYFTPANSTKEDEDMDPFIVVSPKGAWFLICRNQNGLYATPLGANDTWTGKHTTDATAPTNALAVIRFADDFGYPTFKSGIFNAAAAGM